jgi:small subunit ribosomal protein S4
VTKRRSRKYGLSRRIGYSLWGRAKDSVHTRNYPPGQHGRMGFGKKTDFGEQLFEKQKLKQYYGDITEKQFRNIYKEASRRKGDTSENLVGLLESMLISVIYRSNIAKTVFQARQLISHGHILVDGVRVTVSTYRLKPGQVVSVREKSKQIGIVQEAVSLKERNVPEYITFDENKMTCTYNRLPQFSEVPYPIEMKPNMVVEFYSR